MNRAVDTRARAAASGMPLLEVQGLAVDFITTDGPVHAVESADLTLAAGETVAIVG